MTLSDLAVVLQEAGVREDAYALGQDRDESYCIVREGSKWAIYYSEHGSRTDLQVFDSEDAACKSLFTRVTSDPTARCA